MGAKSVMRWSSQISPSHVVQLLRLEKDWQKAKIIFDSATAEYGNGFRHDSSTFHVMITKLVSANQFRRAEEFLERMKEEKCKITEEIFLTVCRGYGRVHRPLDSIRVFDKMKDFECEPSQKSYITVFAILVEENQLKIALRFYKHMRKIGIPPSVPSLNVLIKALCKNEGTVDAGVRIFREMPSHGCMPDSYTYGTLINGFCRYGRIVEAKEMFEEMETKGCSPSVVTYTSLIHGLCRSENLDEAVKLFQTMASKGIEPNVLTYSSLMDGMCKNGRSSKAMELLEMMFAKRLKPNMITYSTLIHGLCSEGKLREAVELLDRLKLQGLKPDAGLYGKIINGFCDIGKFQEAANFIDEMALGGVSPNRLTWSLHTKIHNRVVKGLCLNGDENRAFQCYMSMRTRGISTEAETFDSLVKSFSKKGDFHKSCRIIDEMVVDGCVPDEEIWRVVVGGLSDQKKGLEAANLLQLELARESSLTES